jgi:hypothetical protein
MIRETARRANCANNQHQIVIGMLAYAVDNDQRFPTLYADGSTANGTKTGSDAQPSALKQIGTTIASFELLSSVTGGDLTAKVFADPANPTIRPNSEAASNFNVKTADNGVANKWLTGATIGLQGKTAMAYAYDWAVPNNPRSSVRVVVADRPQAIMQNGSLVNASNHKEKFVVAYCDGHTTTLRADSTITPPAVNVTYMADKNALTTYTVTNPDALNQAGFATPDGTPDSIFDDFCDNKANANEGTTTSKQVTFHSGSVYRAWVK